MLVCTYKMSKEYKVLPDGKVKVSINIPVKTLQRIDFDRKKNKKTRSNWITSAILNKFTNEGNSM